MRFGLCKYFLCKNLGNSLQNSYKYGNINKIKKYKTGRESLLPEWIHYATCIVLKNGRSNYTNNDILFLNQK